MNAHLPSPSPPHPSGREPAHGSVGSSGSISMRDVMQIVGVVGAPLVLLTGLAGKYAIVQTLGCRDPRAGYAVHAVAVATLLLCMGGTWLGEREWRRAERDLHRAPPREHVPHHLRSRAMGIIGTLVSALCVLVVIAQWMPQFALPLCAQ